MTERTFREQSPARPSTSSGVPAPRRQEPPVPRVPETYTNVPPIPQKSQRRSASIDELQNRRGAAQRGPANRNSMVESSAPKSATNPGLAAAKRVTSAQAPPSFERTDSNNSVNFSYPNRARPISPPPSSRPMPETPPQPAEQTPQRVAKQPVSQPVTSAISQAEAQRIQYQMTQASQQPVKQRRKREGPMAEGSHLHTGTMGHKPTVTPLEPGPPVQDEESPQEPDRGRNNARLSGQASHFPPSPTSPSDSQASGSDAERTVVRRAQRASGALQKQPSVVREDWEGEQEEPSSVEPSPLPTKLAPNKRQTAEANMSRKIEGASSTKPDMEPEPEHAEISIAPHTLVTPEPRRPSLSPSRSTRFSNRLSSDMAEGQRHQPPARSASPMKSALKHTHSPSPQILAVDVHKPRDASLSPSEASSAEAPSRSKKSAHVKFDTHPAVVGISAEPDSPDTTQIVSPQYREKEKKWFSLTRKPQNRVVLSEDSDDEDAMKPRPALPTFGSVRNVRRTEAEPSSGQKIIPSPSSSSSSSSLSSGTGPTTMDTSISSEHALGGLLTQQAEQYNAHASPLALKIDTAESTATRNGVQSVRPGEDKRDIHTNVTQPVSHQQDPKSVVETHEATNTPVIAVLPATPGTEEELQHQDEWLTEIPGGFPEAGQGASASSGSVEPHEPTAGSKTISGQTVEFQPSIDEPDLRQERMPSIQEEDSDKDSIYSDAAEDLSDLEGDGFGSINAIVRSPVAPSPGIASTISESPIVTMPQRDIERESEQDLPAWNDTGARWKDNVENAKRASLQPAPPITEKSAKRLNQESASRTMAESVSKPVSSRVASNPSTSGPTQSPNSAVPTKSARADTQPTMRKSMRSAPEAEAAPTLRNRARNTPDNEGSKPLRSSMRTSAASAAPPAPAVVASPLAQPQGTLMKKNLRAVAPPAQQKPKPLPPPVNNDSDSESSFKRRRRARANDSGKHTMRRSMRAGAPSADSAAAPADRRAIRSLSPVERRPLSPVGGQSAMRTTLRGSTDNVPTMRATQNGERRSSSLFGRKKEAKSPTRPVSSVGTFGKSRYADSDDEGESKPKTYKSRFADSSDEEDELRPVRGIPRNTRDEDSTDLDDSSDEETNKRRAASQQQKLSITVPSSPPTSERPTSPTSPDGKKKRGFFGRLRKNKDGTASPSNKEEAATVNGNREHAQEPKRDVDTAALGFKSNAEKEALVEQTRKMLEAARERPTSPAPETVKKRSTPQRVMSDSWPLTPEATNGNDTGSRPMTSDGSGNPQRPDYERQASSGTATSSPTGSGEALGKSGKKKRFPLLRKAFGLKD